MFGCLAVAATHLSANLINDYADSKSGADWQDKTFFGFFGGSKLIQEGMFSEKFYLRTSVIFAFIATLSALILVLLSNNTLIIIYFAGIIFTAWSYSHKPFQFSYHYIGEFVIFLLFGPSLIMGGYYIQTGIFPTLQGLLLSLPFGLLTTAILYINEIPDYPQDAKVGKHNWVSLFKIEKAYIGYVVLVFCAFLSIITCIALGYLSLLSLLSFIFIIWAIKAAKIAREFPSDKVKLVESSKLTIKLQAAASIIIILDIIL